MPAPPPESEPAIVRAMGGAEGAAGVAMSVAAAREGDSARDP